MEDLIELVAASFARHGIQCPQDPPIPTSSSCGDGALPRPGEAEPRPQTALFAAALPEHNYRKMVQGDPSP
jgi:hypothetical protein